MTQRRTFLVWFSLACGGCAGSLRPYKQSSANLLRVDTDDIPILAVVIGDHFSHYQPKHPASAKIFTVNLSVNDTNAVLKKIELRSIVLVSVMAPMDKKNLKKAAGSLILNFRYSQSKEQCVVELDEARGPLAAETWKFECRKTPSGWRVYKRALINVA